MFFKLQNLTRIGKGDGINQWMQCNSSSVDVIKDVSVSCNCASIAVSSCFSCLSISCRKCWTMWQLMLSRFFFILSYIFLNIRITTVSKALENDSKSGPENEFLQRNNICCSFPGLLTFLNGYSQHLQSSLHSLHQTKPGKGDALEVGNARWTGKKGGGGFITIFSGSWVEALLTGKAVSPFLRDSRFLGEKVCVQG